MNKHSPLTPAQELHANTAVPFERAFAMPKSVYTSPEFLALEQKHIFAQDWLCAGRADALKEAVEKPCKPLQQDLGAAPLGRFEMPTPLELPLFRDGSKN